MTALAQAGAIFRRDAMLAVSYEAGFALQWIATIAQVVVTFFIASLVPPSPHFGYDGRTAPFFSYALVNLAFATLQSTALSSFGRTLRDSQLQGTLEALLATPAAIPVIVLSGSLWAFTLTVLTAATMLLVGVVFGLDLRHANLVTLALFLILTIAALSPLGVLSAAATIVLKQNAPFDVALNLLTYLAAGVYLPVSLLPHPLQLVSWLLPITHALAGFRAAVAGASLTATASDAIWLAIAAALLVPVSLRAFGNAVSRAKSDGTLGTY
jgi:ABC-type multidrug transport system permease subunit